MMNTHWQTVETVREYTISKSVNVQSSHPYGSHPYGSHPYGFHEGIALPMHTAPQMYIPPPMVNATIPSTPLGLLNASPMGGHLLPSGPLVPDPGTIERLQSQSLSDSLPSLTQSRNDPFGSRSLARLPSDLDVPELDADLLAEVDNVTPEQMEEYKEASLNSARTMCHILDGILVLCLRQGKKDIVISTIQQELLITRRLCRERQEKRLQELIHKEPCSEAVSYMESYPAEIERAVTDWMSGAPDNFLSGLLYRDDKGEVVAHDEEAVNNHCVGKVRGEHRSLMQEIVKSTSPAAIEQYAQKRYQQSLEQYNQYQDILNQSVQGADPLETAEALERVGQERRRDSFFQEGCVTIADGRLSYNREKARSFARRKLIVSTYRKAVNLFPHISDGEVEALIQAEKSALSDPKALTQTLIKQLQSRGKPSEEYHWTVGASGVPDYFRRCCWIAERWVKFDKDLMKRLVRRKIALAKVRKLNEIDQSIVNSYIAHQVDKVKKSPYDPQASKFFKRCCTANASGEFCVNQQAADEFAREQLLIESPWIV